MRFCKIYLAILAVYFFGRLLFGCTPATSSIRAPEDRYPIPSSWETITPNLLHERSYHDKRSR